VRSNLSLCCLLAIVMCGGTVGTARTVDPPPRSAAARFMSPHVRGASPRMSLLLERAIQRSPTFASLVKSLEDTDVIVHVEEVRTLPSGVDGRLTFVYATTGVRYLRAQVLAGRGDIDTMSVVGHELQHAVEVAEHANVRDEDEFSKLYARIGDQPARPDRYDTAAAREAGRRVRNEMN
jgi:hypothetical protein